MNKKIRNRILYITVALLWGVAIYRTFANYQSNEEGLVNTSNHAISITPLNAYMKDSFDLTLPNRDPFLNKSFIQKVESDIKSNTASNKNSDKKIMPVEKPKLIWPDIEYFGFVKNRTTSSTRCMLKINQQTVQLSMGEKFSGVEVLNAFKDSIIVKFEANQKTFYK